MRADTPPRRIARLGPFPVSAAADPVRQFSDSLRVDGARPLPARAPLTYPIRWLALPEIRSEIERELSMLPGLPVQESQTFENAREIEVGCDYRLAVEVHVEGGEQQRFACVGWPTMFRTNESSPWGRREGKLVCVGEASGKIAGRTRAG